MEFSTTTLALIAIIAAFGLIWTLIVSEPANAWHSQFESKKECVEFLKSEFGNTTSEAQFECNKLFPH
jgi:hypothetical protein